MDLRISPTTSRNPFKALIATDDAASSSVEYSALKQLHFDTVSVHDDGEMLHSIHAEKPDLVILDADLPAAGGLEACRRLREDPATAAIPIIMVTDGDEAGKIEALETGADDCVAKPLRVEELMAHIKALARRALKAVTPAHRLRAGPIDMDLDRWTVKVSGKPIELTKKEFRLLQTLLEAKGRALTRDYLLQEAWSHGTIHGLDTRTVDVHIGRLRRKLGEAGRYIITVRNVGFRFDLLPEWLSSG